MVVVSDPDLSWAVTKAALVVVSALASVVCLAWAGGTIAFPSESEEQQVEEKTTDSRPSSRARPRDANWPYGSKVAPKVLSLIRKILVAEFYLANICRTVPSACGIVVTPLSGQEQAKSHGRAVHLAVPPSDHGCFS